MNNNLDLDEIIRPPDAVRQMQLIEEDDRGAPFTEEQLVNQAILNSIQDWKEVQKQNDEYEETLLQEFKKTKLERENMFRDLIVTLKKIAKHDKNVAQVLGLIENIVEGYCSAYMEHCELDEKTIVTIFNELSKLRVKKETVELLRTIIRKEQKIF